MGTSKLRLTAFFVRILLGSLWAALLVIPSLVLLREDGISFVGGSQRVWLAVSGITAGNFVFMYVVADRLCRVRERRVVDLFQLATLVTFGIAMVMTAALWTPGAGR